MVERPSSSSLLAAVFGRRGSFRPAELSTLLRWLIGREPDVEFIDSQSAIGGIGADVWVDELSRTTVLKMGPRSPDASDAQRVVVSALGAQRDALGLIPLFWATTRLFTFVATDIEVVERILVDPAEPDLTSVFSYIRRVSLGARSFIKGISRVLPAHVLERCHFEPQQRRFWFPPAVDPNLGAPDIAEDAVRTRILAALNSAISPAVRYGIELSGGLDSSTLVCFSERVPAFSKSAVYLSAQYSKQTQLDESRYVADVDEVVAGPVLRFDGMAIDDRNFSRPVLEMPGGAIVTNLGTDEISLCRDLNLTDLVLGVGGDQLFDETSIFPDLLFKGHRVGTLLALLATTPAECRRRLGTLNSRFVHASSGIYNLASTIRSFTGLGMTKQSHVFVHDFQPHPTPLGDDAGTVMQRTLLRPILEGRLQEWISGLTCMWRQHGVRCHFPLLDLRVVEAVLALPASARTPSVRNRELLRRVASPYLPQSIVVRRGKANFSAVIVNYFRRLLRHIEDACEVPTVLDQLIDRGALRLSCQKLAAAGAKEGDALQCWDVIAATHAIAWAKFLRSRQDLPRPRAPIDLY